MDVRVWLPRTKVESIYPATRFAGQLGIGGRSIDVSGWPGMIGHNWGAEHAERWIWIQASEFDPWGTHLDVAAGKIVVAGRTSPWLAGGLLGMDGEVIRLGGPGPDPGDGLPRIAESVCVFPGRQRGGRERSGVGLAKGLR